jgi:hypothetical protein
MTDSPMGMRSPKASPPTISKPWHRVGMGLLLALAMTLVVAFLQLGLFKIWFNALPERPNFTDNGLSYLAIGYLLFVPPIDFLLFAAVFAVAIPVSFGSRHRAGHPPFPVWQWTIVTALLTAVAFALFLGVGGTHLLLPLTALPAMAAMGLGVWTRTKLANEDLARLRVANGGAKE